MIVRLLDRGDVGELLLEGSLEDQCTQETEQIFDRMAERFSHIVLNLALLTHVSPGSLRAIKKLNMKMRQKGGTLVLRNVHPSVMEVLEVTGYAGVLSIESNRWGGTTGGVTMTEKAELTQGVRER